MPRGSRIVLKFEGVNGFADLYVDDVYIASHQNGFLTWNAEITEQAAGKEKAELRLIMDEESDQSAHTAMEESCAAYGCTSSGSLCECGLSHTAV